MRRFLLVTLTALLLSITGYLCFANLSSAPLVRWDESTNVEVVKESIQNQSFPVLYLGGKPFFEKPPLWYWINAALTQLIGTTSVSMRLVSAVSGFFIINSCVTMSYLWWGRISALITWITLLTTSHLFVTNSGGVFSTHTFRTADIDAFQMLLIVLTTWITSGSEITRITSVFIGLLTGLAVLTKGPIGLVVLSIYTLTNIRSKSKGDSFNILYMWLSAIIIILPWYIYMLVLFGSNFMQLHVFYHLSDRLLMPIEGHHNSWWYYLAVVSNLFVFPAFSLLILSLVWIVYKKLYARDRKLRFVIFLLWAFFLIPTLVQTKLAWYILPIYPFTALIIGASISDVFKYFSKQNEFKL